MPRRRTTLSALWFGAFALMLVFGDTAQAECLTAPRGPAPEGQHWFYRTDRATKQKCWHLRERDARDPETTGATPTFRDASPDVATREPPAAAEPLSRREQQALFQDFLRWHRQRGGQP